MRKALFATIHIILTITIFSACSNNEDLSTPQKVYKIYVLFTPEGFCNMGYNDNTIKAIETLSGKYGYRYSFCVPETIEDGMEYYMNWYNEEPDDNVERTLFIFASGIYDAPLANAPHPKKNSRKDILLFEVKKEVPYAYTFDMSYYGASYMIGYFYLQETDVRFQIIAANLYLEGLEEVIDGFTTATKDMSCGSVELNCISDTPNGGLNNENLAFAECKMAFHENTDKNNIFVPYAGSSNMGVYRFSQSNYQTVVGVDCIDPNLYSYTFLCMNKRIDLALDDFLEPWINGDEIPRNTLYTLESGKVVVDRATALDSESELLDEIKKLAIAKEKEYFQKEVEDGQDL